MDNTQRFNTTPDPQGDHHKLAQWLQLIMDLPQAAQNRVSPGTSFSETTRASLIEEHDTQLELLLNSDYHLHFYQQLPDFIMALLNNDSQAATHYAPLLYHLAGCSECHQSYLELYDAMHAAVYPHEPRPILGQGTRTLEATPPRMLAHLCQVWISQGEAILRQARRDGISADTAVRSLLQLALRVSARIVQSSVRRQALRDLVRVATLFDAPASPEVKSDSVAYSYTPALTGAGGRGATRRGMDMLTRSADIPQEQRAIILQSRSLEGSITQNGQVLELHLHDLAEVLRGHFVTISVLLGSLIEPIRWLGGNPRAISSTIPVDASGALTAPLGETELRLSNPEERNMLEATFLLLEVRVAD